MVFLIRNPLFLVLFALLAVGLGVATICDGAKALAHGHYVEPTWFLFGAIALFTGFGLVLLLLRALRRAIR